MWSMTVKTALELYLLYPCSIIYLGWKRPWNDARVYTMYYHTSNSRKCMGVNGEALQLHAVYKKPYFLLQVTRESVSVLQVT